VPAQLFRLRMRIANEAKTPRTGVELHNWRSADPSLFRFQNHQSQPGPISQSLDGVMTVGVSWGYEKKRYAGVRRGPARLFSLYFRPARVEGLLGLLPVSIKGSSPAAGDQGGYKTRLWPARPGCRAEQPLRKSEARPSRSDWSDAHWHARRPPRKPRQETRSLDHQPPVVKKSATPSENWSDHGQLVRESTFPGAVEAASVWWWPKSR